MAENQLLMPKMGESIMEATILKWLKKEGDTVDLDEAVLEIATDKVDSEVPSPFAGILTKIFFNEGDVVPVGQPLALFGGEGNGAVPASALANAAVSNGNVVENTSTESGTTKSDASISQSAITLGDPQPGRFYSPLVLSMASTEGIDMSTLERLPGTGSEGRVTKKDILNFIANGGKSTQQNGGSAHIESEIQPQPEEKPVVVQNASPVQQPAAQPAKPSASVSGNVEIIEMDRMRKLIADHMVRSMQTSPHVTSFVEADVTNLVEWRNRIKSSFEKREKTKITFTPIFIEAVARAIKDYPMINVSVEDSNIIVKRDINIGMAAALPSGNLIVPVVKNADQLNLLGLAKRVNDLADRARAGKLTPDEIQGGTYTLTNVGSFGNVMGTPIINQPQVAILAVGAIRKKPAVIETPQGDFIGIRHMMFLSHSYDHRVVDGALGGMFVRRVADYLEQWDVNREI